MGRGALDDMQTPNRSKVRASGRDVLGCPRYERCRIIVLVLRTSAQLRFPRFFVAGGVSRGDARASGRLPLGLDASTLRASRGLLALAARREYTERSDRHHRCRVLPGHHEHSPGDRPTLVRADSIGDGFLRHGLRFIGALARVNPDRPWLRCPRSRTRSLILDRWPTHALASALA